MADWIDRAKALLENRDGHEATVKELREKALPYTEAQRLSDHAADLARAEDLRGTLAKAREALKALPEEADPETEKKREALTKRVDDARTEIGRLEEKVKERASWQFASGEEAWRHQVLQDLLGDLDRIRDPKEASKGVLADVEKRHVAATTLRKRSIEDHRAAWDTTLAGIAASPKYGGLTISRQLGLVPLGPDPASGLFEFAHLGSGSLPTRNKESGRLVQADDAAIVLVLIPEGTFLMGAQRKDENKPNFDPQAQHDESDENGQAVSVTLSPYFLSKYECTQAQWAAMTGGLDPSAFKAGAKGGKLTPRNPVEAVSWADCVGDRGWLARNRLKLPSEAQWEYACRAGTDTPWICGRDIADLSKVANIADKYCKENGGPTHWRYTLEVDDGHAVHAPVGAFGANAFGLHDVHGNVSEWCHDLHGNRYYGNLARGGTADRTDPVAPEGPGDRVYRGGSWGLTAGDARSAHRGALTPSARYASFGFRAARSVTP